MLCLLHHHIILLFFRLMPYQAFVVLSSSTSWYFLYQKTSLGLILIYLTCYRMSWLCFWGSEALTVNGVAVLAAEAWAKNKEIGNSFWTCLIIISTLKLSHHLMKYCMITTSNWMTLLINALGNSTNDCVVILLEMSYDTAI